ncbi:conserved hypothetical protein [Halorhabdus utahensis DSM 12940]|uniref:Uncharacterized protein n=1 Tax=Halorhabdus utahensis (strain DSM 12940 / JCM 11049 / AX-2) TaxID=519442 RepID=C7NRR2_HALUD|nr:MULTISPECIES: hypothetical protein [Halorhabdus]ACV13017.1 conserved hypothetical protein [Halorhabdus utahensis DSM 12940]WEL17884.1 Putative transcriptional regulator, contains HTHdomain [Halorhabdus sp. SVX81]WEL21761.1 Putative transcriptional regulator, contains HTHdomain [Halorhabdus sp. BNX81]
MQQANHSPSGWEFVATREAAASLIRATVELDPDEHVTRSELATAADVPMKRLYLEDTVSELVDLGVLEAVDSESEPVYTVNEGSEVLEAAARFEEMATERLVGD